MPASAQGFFAQVQPGNRPHEDGDWNTLAQLLFAVNPPNGAPAITALAGGGRAGAPAMLYGANIIATVASGNDSVQAPPAAIGLWFDIFNQGAQTLAIYGAPNPNNNGTLDTMSATGSATSVATNVTIATGKWTRLKCISTGVWKQIISG